MVISEIFTSFNGKDTAGQKLYQRMKMMLEMTQEHFTKVCEDEENIIHRMVEREGDTAAVPPLSHCECEYCKNQVPPDFLAQSYTLSL